MAYQATKIWNHYREIARLSAIGLTKGQIAAKLGKTTAMVSYVLESPLIKHQLDKLQDARDESATDVGNQIDALAPKALAYIDTVIDGVVRDPITGEMLMNPQTGKAVVYDNELRYKAAKDIMAMAGLGPVQRIKKQVAHGLFTAEDLEQFKQRARDVGVVRQKSRHQTQDQDQEAAQDADITDISTVNSANGTDSANNTEQS